MLLSPDFAPRHFIKDTMDNFNKNRGSSSTQKVINDKTRKPEPKAKRNIMLEKFQAFQADVKPPPGQYIYIPRPFFFYGSLTDPSKLQEVLQLPSPPLLKPAKVKSYKIMLWGQYPALVDGPNDSYVDGMAYVVETEQHLQMLKDYETEVYSLTGIRIEMGGKTVSGRTFEWAEDDLSALTEGTWSLEEWRKEVEEEMASHFRPVKD